MKDGVSRRAGSADRDSADHLQDAFRQVNERVRDVSAALSGLAGSFTVICECGDSRCIATVTIEPAAYDQLRAMDGHFLVLPGHVRPGAEQVVEASDGYEVVVRLNDSAPKAGATGEDPG